MVVKYFKAGSWTNHNIGGASIRKPITRVENRVACSCEWNSERMVVMNSFITRTFLQNQEGNSAAELAVGDI